MRYSVLVVVAAAIAGVIVSPSSGQVINEYSKLLPTDGAKSDHFGDSIAIGNGIVAVGVSGDDDNGDGSGSVYLFEASTGAQIAKLLPSDGAEYAQFGRSIAIANGVVAIGATGTDDNGNSSGSAYLFDVATRAQIAKLVPSDGAEWDHFGYSIAIADGVVAVGAPWDDDNGDYSGSAYLFDAATGAQIAKLLPNDGAADDYFGNSIAIDNGVIVVGANFDDNRSGSAYLFEASTGEQIAKLIPNDRDVSDYFGGAVAIDNNVVAVGAGGDDDNGSSSGSAYLFDALTGDQFAKLLPNDGTLSDTFGYSITIKDGVVAVGAVGDADNGRESGSAYLFDASNGKQIVKLLPSDGVAEHFFGVSIAIDNGVVAIGATGDYDNGLESGAAYLFDANTVVNCLDLTVKNLISGDIAIFMISEGTPGAKGITVYGTKSGQTSINNYAGYCATFGIRGVNQDKVIGGLNRTFDLDGEMIFGVNIPRNLSGQRVLFQSTQHGTCPDECMSNLVEMVVQ